MSLERVADTANQRIFTYTTIRKSLNTGFSAGKRLRLIVKKLYGRMWTDGCLFTKTLLKLELKVYSILGQVETENKQSLVFHPTSNES